ncbi:MAG: DNA-protecting protein DprA [Chloroflexi bacterium]|nr:DNA-protecting protein DprA [Chloroflexota bacterium]
MDDPKYWLGLSLVPNIGPKRLALLLETLQDPARIWSASENELRRAGLSPQPLATLIKERQALDLDQEMQRVQRVGAHLITLADDTYPAALKTAFNPPLVLYVRGTLTAQDNLALGIVGTRKATPYGREVTYHFAKDLAAQGVTVISGLAHGIDAQAHRGALDGGGRTIAVLGCGIQQVYPEDHRDLAHAIIEQGAVISEFPIGTPPAGRNFPRRNRIISGLALGVLIPEAPEKSGALITASLAAEQGRDVFAVPGSIFSPASQGTNRLIQDGAKLVLSVEDILSELNVAYEHSRTEDSHTESSANATTVIPAAEPPNAAEAHLLQHLGATPTHIDDLTRVSGLSPAVVASTLAIMELKDLVQVVGPMQYISNYDV